MAHLTWTTGWSGRTIKDLAKYLVADTVKLTEVVAIDGLKVSSKIKLGDYNLINWASVPRLTPNFK